MSILQVLIIRKYVCTICTPRLFIFINMIIMPKYQIPSRLLNTQVFSLCCLLHICAFNYQKYTSEFRKNIFYNYLSKVMESYNH